MAAPGSSSVTRLDCKERAFPDCDNVGENSAMLPQRTTSGARRAIRRPAQQAEALLTPCPALSPPIRPNESGLLRTESWRTCPARSHHTANDPAPAGPFIVALGELPPVLVKRRRDVLSSQAEYSEQRD